MFEVGFSEILVIFVLALIVLGPERLPRVAAQVGKWVGRAKAMARQFREQLEEEVNLENTRKAQASARQDETQAEAQTASHPPEGSAVQGAAGAAGAAAFHSDPSQSGDPSAGPAGAEGAPAAAPDSSSAGAGSAGLSPEGFPGDASVASQAPGPDARAEEASAGSHQDLSNETWPYHSPAPPPEVADVLHDLLMPARQEAVPAVPPQVAAGGRSAQAASSGPPAAAAQNAAREAAPPPPPPMEWPHDQATPEATIEKTSEGVQPATHESET